MDNYAAINLLQGIKPYEPVSFEQWQGIKELLEDIQEDVRRKANKAAGTTNVAKAFKSVIKSAKKVNNSDLQGAFRDGEYICVCDSHRAMRTKADISLPMAKGIKLDTIYKKMWERITSREEIHLPDRAELLTEVKTCRKRVGSKGAVNYTFEDGLTVNAEFLLDAMEATGADILTRQHGDTRNGMIIEGNGVEALLLPVMVSCYNENRGVWGQN